MLKGARASTICGGGGYGGCGGGGDGDVDFFHIFWPTNLDEYHTDDGWAFTVGKIQDNLNVAPRFLLAIILLHQVFRKSGQNEWILFWLMRFLYGVQYGIKDPFFVCVRKIFMMIFGAWIREKWIKVSFTWTSQKMIFLPLFTCEHFALSTDT